MIRNTTRNQKLGWVLFLAYLAMLVYFVFFAESFGRTGSTKAGYAYNLELFKEIRRFLVYRKQLGVEGGHPQSGGAMWQGLCRLDFSCPSSAEGDGGGTTLFYWDFS